MVNGIEGLLDKLSRLISLSQHISFNQFLRKKPISIASNELVYRLKQIAPKLNMVIDAGANIGQFSRAIHQQYPAAVIYSIEPDPEIFQVLQRNLSDIPDNLLKPLQTGLAETVQERTFYKYKNNQTSSFTPLVSKENHNPVVGTTQLKAETLDQLFSSEIRRPLLLKLDLQGYELNALQGGSRLLKKVDYVICEIGFEQNYKNQPSFDQINRFLVEKDFELFTVLNIAKTKGLVSQMDALYGRVENR